MHYGEQSNDSTSIEMRENTDVKNLRTEVALYGADSVQNGYIKGYYYQSERGLPGATIFYNTQNFSSQRIWDHSAFLQGHYERNFNNIVSLQLNAKYNYTFTHYLDPIYLGSEGKEENRYTQNEYYLSGAVVYRPISGLSFNLSQDGIINTLEADLDNFTSPTRYTSLTAIAGKYVNNWVMATASVLMTAMKDVMADNTQGQQRFKASPYVSVAFKPFEQVDFRVRAFYKNIFRLPTFNDLYYTDMGNAYLKPELAKQHNVGLSFTQPFRIAEQRGSEFRINADYYYNRISDKIIAYPKGQQFRWTMLNLGLVKINGLDVNAQLHLVLPMDFYLTAKAQYTYQTAIDVTDPNDTYYGDQIPYIPWHSGSAVGMFGWQNDWQQYGLNYSFIYVGERYNQQENIIYNYTQPWYTHDLSVFGEWNIQPTAKRSTGVADLPSTAKRSISPITLRVAIDVNNLLSQDYDVIINYPMPKRNYKCTVSITY